MGFLDLQGPKVSYYATITISGLCIKIPCIKSGARIRIIIFPFSLPFRVMPGDTMKLLRWCLMKKIEGSVWALALIGVAVFTIMGSLDTHAESGYRGSEAAQARIEFVVRIPEVLYLGTESSPLTFGAKIPRTMTVALLRFNGAKEETLWNGVGSGRQEWRVDRKEEMTYTLCSP